MDFAQLQNLLQGAGGGGVGGGGAGPLVSFKAGAMAMSGTTVTADARKGQVVIDRSPDTGMLQFKWQLRPNMTTEKDIMILPDTAKWEKVPECKDGRVFLLRISGAKHFFWMQEPKDEKDEEHFKKITELFGNPVAGSQEGGIDQAALLSMVGGSQNQNQTSQPPTQQQPQQSAPNTAPASTTESNAASSAAQSSSQGQQQGSQQQSAAAANLMAQIMALSNDPRVKFMSSERSLSKILDPDEVVPLLLDDEKTVEELIKYLPEGHRSVEGLTSTLRSPQIQQAINRLQLVVSSPEGIGLINQLGLSFKGVGVDPFLKGVQEVADNEKSEDGSSTRKDNENA